MESISSNSLKFPDEFDVTSTFDINGNPVTRFSLWKIRRHSDRIDKLYEFFINHSVTSLDYSMKKVVYYEIYDKSKQKKMIFINDILTQRVYGYGILKVIQTIKCDSNTLVNLNFSSNSITDKEAIFLAEALMQNRCLKHLILRNNRITDIGLISFSEMLKLNNCIEELDLKNNRFTINGIIRLSRALIYNKGLKSIDIRDSDCNIHRIKPLTKVAYLNKNIKNFLVI